MWFVYLRTSFATSEGVLMFSSAPTAPARLVGPCMQEASSCTTPSALGRPPYPTESSFGSSSWIFTPSTAASSGSAPCRIRSNAFWTARSPLPLEMITGLAAQREVGGRGRGGRMGCAMPVAALAATPTAVVFTNSRRVSTSGTARSIRGVLGSTRPPRPCQLARRGMGSYVPSVSYEPPSPLAILRGFFGVALVVTILALFIEFIRIGGLNWKLVSLTLLLWAMWGFAADAYRLVVAPLAGFLNRALFTGRAITLDDETQFLEQRLRDPRLEPEHEILSGIRLAEIYRQYQFNRPKAEALLDRLLLKYPDSRELQIARRHPA